MRLGPWIERCPAPLRVALKRLRRAVRMGGPSADYRVLSGEAPRRLLGGFADDAVAERQQAAFAPLLEELRAGRPREDFRTLARAVALTGLRPPSVIEVGCGSGWNAEVLTRLGGEPIRYVGIDYSPTMLAIARRAYPEHRFVLADALNLPLRDGAAEILVSGGILMHLLDYRDAIRESRRVARRWCVFHTIPVMTRRNTTLLEKRAYGSPTIEVIFNEAELKRLFDEFGFRVRHVLPNIPYDLEDILGERTVVKTFLCEVDG